MAIGSLFHFAPVRFPAPESPADGHAALWRRNQQKILRPSAIGRMARSAALLLILRQPSPAKECQERRQVFFSQFLRCGLFLAPHPEPNPECPHGRDDDGRTTSRRGLVHACRFVIQTRREPAVDLRDAHAAGVTSLSVYGGWVRRSRRAVLRW